MYTVSKAWQVFRDLSVVKTSNYFKTMLHHVHWDVHYYTIMFIVV